MALKPPQPLDEKNGNSLLNHLNEEPSKEKVIMLKNAAEIGKK